MKFTVTIFVLAVIVIATAGIGVLFRTGHHESGTRIITYDSKYDLSSQRRTLPNMDLQQAH